MKQTTTKLNSGAYAPPLCSELYITVCNSILTLSDGTSEPLDPSEYEGSDDWSLSNQ